MEHAHERLTDSEIVRMLEARDEGGLELLCLNHAEHVKTRLLRIFGPRREPEIDEALSDAVLTVWNRIDQFEQQRSLSAWLFTIAKNNVIAMLRSESVRPMLELLGIEELDGRRLRTPAHQTRSEERAWVLSCLRDCIAQLSPIRQDVILASLVETEHTSNQVLAARWDTTPTVISKTRQRARVQLGKLLRKVIL